LKKNYFFVFWKHDSLRENFKNSVPKGFISSPIDVLSLNFVKRKNPIGQVVRYLPDKNFAWLSSSRYCADRAQNLPQPAPVLQISSKSVYFRWSHIRTCEHHQSVSNIRLKPSLEPNNSDPTFTNNGRMEWLGSLKVFSNSTV